MHKRVRLTGPSMPCQQLVRQVECHMFKGGVEASGWIKAAVRKGNEWIRERLALLPREPRAEFPLRRFHTTAASVKSRRRANEGMALLFSLMLEASSEHASNFWKAEYQGWAMRWMDHQVLSLCQRRGQGRRELFSVSREQRLVSSGGLVARMVVYCCVVGLILVPLFSFFLPSFLHSLFVHELPPVSLLLSQPCARSDQLRCPLALSLLPLFRSSSRGRREFLKGEKE